MWWEFGKHLAVLVEPGQLRWRHFPGWQRGNVCREAVSSFSMGNESEPDSTAAESLSTIPRDSNAYVYVSEEMCRIGWVRLPAQSLNADEARALVMSTLAKTEHAAADLHVETETLPTGILYASVDQQVLAATRRAIEHQGACVKSARPVLAPVVSNWLWMQVTRKARKRHLFVVSSSSTHAFTAENGELTGTARYVSAVGSEDLTDRLAALRISMGLSSGDHDVMISPLAFTHHGNGPRTNAIPLTAARRDFADLYSTYGAT